MRGTARIEGSRGYDRRVSRPVRSRPTRRRYQLNACIDSSGLFLCDDINDYKGSVDAAKVVDAWSIATQMKKTLRGTIFSTHIA